MKHFVVTSLRKDAGKTSVIIGLAKLIKGQIGYLKPFGDRLLYRKKRLWDYDSAVISKIFNIEESPEGMSMGFDHSKLRYIYDADTAKEKLHELFEIHSKDKDYLFIESGKNISHGISANLDALTVCQTFNSQLIIVVSGNNDEILDDLTYIKRKVDLKALNIAGVIINKVKDIDDFKMVYESALENLGLTILGILPFHPDLTYPTVQYISDLLFAKNISGEGALNATIQDVFVGAMSGDAAQRVDKFKKKKKLIITSGDRSDMILAALDTKCVGIVLTNNILPPPNIIARASEENVPKLLVQNDTHQTAKKIDQAVPMINYKDTKKIDLLASYMNDYCQVSELIK